LPVVALVDDILGLSAVIEIAALNRFLKEADLFTEARITIDPRAAASTWRRLGELPGVAATTAKSIWRAVFDEKIVGLLLVAATILTGFGLIIAVGVVYNSARIAFHERAWELASLRILGFRRNEVLRILLAELAIETVLALPLGLVAAQWIIGFLLELRGNESFSMPATISSQTFATATLVIIGIVVVSSLIVRRKIDRFDLAAALKVRD
jgi:putative ABC transport system permease protein